jgi:hypothetical protein
LVKKSKGAKKKALTQEAKAVFREMQRRRRRQMRNYTAS